MSRRSTCLLSSDVHGIQSKGFCEQFTGIINSILNGSFQASAYLLKTLIEAFLSVSDKICHSPFKKVKRQPTLIMS